MKDIKETKEFIAGLKEALKAGKKVRDIVSDGVGVDDLPKAFELVKDQASKLEIYSAAVKDVSSIKEELMDLSKEEIVELVLEIVKASSEVEGA